MCFMYSTLLHCNHARVFYHTIVSSFRCVGDFFALLLSPSLSLSVFVLDFCANFADTTDFYHFKRYHTIRWWMLSKRKPVNWCVRVCVEYHRISNKNCNGKILSNDLFLFERVVSLIFYVCCGVHNPKRIQNSKKKVIRASSFTKQEPNRK